MLGDMGLPTTGDPSSKDAPTTITSETFPSFCSTWCAAAPGGTSCAGFEMKLWD